MSITQADDSTEIHELQRRMARIRREMHEDVRDAVRGAQSLADWRSILGNHPWTALSIAFAVGFLAAPGRRRASRARSALSPPTLAEANTGVAAVRRAPPPPPRPGVLGPAFSLLTPVLIRAAQNYALNHLEQWLAAHPFPIKEGDRAREPEPREAPSDSAGAPTVRFPDRR